MIHDFQMTAHAQMYDNRALGRSNNDIFAAALQRQYFCALQLIQIITKRDPKFLFTFKNRFNDTVF